MAAPTTPTTPIKTAASGPAGAVKGSRTRLHPAQKLVLVAAAGVLIGSFLPWVETGFGVYRGFAGPGVWTFYAGIIGVGAGLVPSLTLARIQTAMMAAVALALPLWQIGRMVRLVGFGDWVPGMGLMMVLGSGVFAAKALFAMKNEKNEKNEKN